MPNIIIKIGVAIDRNAAGAFAQIPAMARQAAKAAAEAGGGGVVKNPMSGLPQASAKALWDFNNKLRQNYFLGLQKQNEDAAKKQQAAQAAALAYVAKVRDRYFRDEQKKAESAQRYVDRLRDRYYRDEQRRQEKAEAAQERLAERAAAHAQRVAERQAAHARRLAERQWRSLGRQVNNGIGRGISAGASMLGLPNTIGGLVGAPIGMARNMLQGMGADLDFGSGMGRAMELQRAAAMLSNQAYMPGEKGPNGQRQSSADFVKESFAVGNEMGEDPMLAMQGMANFVKKTGDLATIRPILRDLGALSKAFGTDLNDMADAAADVALNLGDIPDKGEVIVGIMKNIAAQGKKGAVEVSDLAKQMAKVAKGAQFFEGGAGNNIKTFTAFAELGKAHGGATSAISSATGVETWVNQFNKAARLKGMDKLLGKDFIRGKDGKYTNPELIIAQALRKSGGNLEKIQGAFADAKATVVTRAATKLYGEGVAAYKADHPNATKAELVEAGVAKYLEEFHKLTKATTEEEELLLSLAAVQRDAKSEVQRFNNVMTSIGGELLTVFLPALEGLTPAVKKVSGGIVTAIDFVTNAKLNASIADATKAGGNARSLATKITALANDPNAKLTPAQYAELQATGGGIMGTLEAKAGEFAKVESDEKNGKRGFAKDMYQVGERIEQVFDIVKLLGLSRTGFGERKTFGAIKEDVSSIVNREVDAKVEAGVAHQEKGYVSEDMRILAEALKLLTTVIKDHPERLKSGEKEAGGTPPPGTSSKGRDLAGDIVPF